MRTCQAIALAGSLLIAQGCTRTVYVPVASSSPQPSAPAAAPVPAPAPPRERPQPEPVTILGIPAAYLPSVGQCRIWVPGAAPARQRYKRSQSCDNIGSQTPIGSWVVYRPSDDRGLAHVRVTDRQRPGKIHVVHVFEVESGRFLGDETYDEPVAQNDRPEDRRRTTGAVPTAAVPTAAPTTAPRRQPQQAPTANPTVDPGPGAPIPVPPPVAPRTTPAQTTPLENGPDRGKPAPVETGVPTGDLPTFEPTIMPGAPNAPAPNTPAPNAPAPKTAPNTPAPNTPAPNAPAPNTAPLDIPPGHLPPTGECRIWIPGTPPGRQPHRNSGDCDQITREAPAGSWVVYRPTVEKKLVHVRVIDARRAGVVVAVRVYDETGKFVREQRS